jgi:hypothetical protein
LLLLYNRTDSIKAWEVFLDSTLHLYYNTSYIYSHCIVRSVTFSFTFGCLCILCFTIVIPSPLLFGILLHLLMQINWNALSRGLQSLASIVSFTISITFIIMLYSFSNCIIYLRGGIAKVQCFLLQFTLVLDFVPPIWKMLVVRVLIRHIRDFRILNLCASSRSSVSARHTLPAC